eukprot:5338756-Pyramimonas_sp.AAC.1
MSLQHTALSTRSGCAYPGIPLRLVTGKIRTGARGEAWEEKQGNVERNAGRRVRGVVIDMEGHK